VLILAPGAWFLLRFFGLKLRTSVLLSAGFLALGLLAFGLRGGLNIEEGKQDASWYAVQDWFRTNSDINSLAIVPPSEAGFRVRSQRASYGDWFDGTKAFFSEEYAEYWLDHMSSLGYVVHYADHSIESLNCVFKNERFAIYQLPAKTPSSEFFAAN
jgi:hypothetical protein